MREAGRPPFLALEQVTKLYPGTIALDGVSLAFWPGEVHAVLGENGAGKSTLLAILSGKAAADSGTIRIDGRPACFGSPRDALRLGVATVYQHPVMAPALTIAENFLLGGRQWWRRPRRAAAARRMEELGARVGLRVRADAPVSELSLGERQEAEILRALEREPRLLLLDEPTSMLAPQASERLRATVRRLAATGTAVAFVTHRLDEALAFADRVTVMRRGRVAGTLPPERLRAAGQALEAEIVGMMFGGGLQGPPAAERRERRNGAAVLSASDVSVDRAKAWPGLDRVSLAVALGEVLGIAGIDGNGQRLLSEVIAGQLAPDAGSVFLEGDDLGGLGVRARREAGLRYLTDDRLGEGSVGSLPVSHNLFLKDIGRPPLWTAGFERRSRIREAAGRLAAAFGVRGDALAPAAWLSGGNLQKVLLARELAGGVKALVLHKPTHGLDLASAIATRRRIAELACGGAGILLLSTDLDEVLELSDRVAVMSDGRLGNPVANGPYARQAVARLIAQARE